MPRTTLLTAVVALTLLLGGCIESQRTLATPDADAASADTDGASPDTTATADTATADTATPPDATPEDTGTPPEDTTPADTTVVPEDTTGPDTTAITCDDHGDCAALPVGPCEVPRCISLTCGVEPADAGTACDNGTGQMPGTCVNGGFQAPDRCDGDGQCVDSAPILAGDLPSTLLSGDWFFVLSTMAVPDAESVTFRGDLAVDSGGDLALTTTGISRQTAGLDATVFGNVCMTSGRDVRIELGADRVLRGAFTEDGQILVAVGLPDRSLLVAVRPTGDATDVSGTYDFVTTSLEPGNALRTWVGTIPFASGCQSDDGEMVTTSAAGLQADWTFARSPLGDTGCFSVPEDGVTALDLPLQLSAVGGSGTLIRWRGAASDGASLIVMTRDDSAPNPRYGTIVLVRRPTEDLGLGGPSWAGMFQGIRVPGQAAVGELTAVAPASEGALTGRARATGDAESAALSGTLAAHDAGLFEVSLTRDGVTGSTANYLVRLASRGDVGFFYTSSTNDFDLAPASGSLGLLVRRGAADVSTLLP